METVCFMRPDRETKSVRSLQSVCRNSIMRCLGLENIQQVADLPIPPIMKEFLCTFHIPTDFDLDGIYEDYNFNFPNHVHHKTHQIHPAKCVLNGANVLLKFQSSEECNMCKSVAANGTRDCEKTREKWAYLRHGNLMHCRLRMYDPIAKVSFHVLDFPVINLEDLAIRAFIQRKQIPEHLIWKVLGKLTSVLQYLSEEEIYPWELCQPRHVVVNESGDVMLENMLLYLPAKSGAPYQIETCAHQSNYSSPEQLKGQPLSTRTLIWGLGCILSEFASLIPSSIQRMGNLKISFPPFAKPRSSALCRTIERCLNEEPIHRPTLKELARRADQALKNGDKHLRNWHENLLDFCKC